MTIGNTVTQQVNARGTKVFVKAVGSGTESEYTAIQDKRLVINYDVVAEPLTSNNTAFFAGAFLGGLFTGTVLYTTDVTGAVGVEGTFLYLTAKDSNSQGNTEREWKMKLTTKGSATKTWTFNGILQSFDLSASIPGGAKYDLSIFVTSEPVLT